MLDDTTRAKVMLVGSELNQGGMLINGLPVQVILADNPSEAVNKACRTTFDAVLIDMERNTPQSSLMLACELRGMAGYDVTAGAHCH